MTVTENTTRLIQMESIGTQAREQILTVKEPLHILTIDMEALTRMTLERMKLKTSKLMVTRKILLLMSFQDKVINLSSL